VSTRRRASAFGAFTAGYGIFWFLGSAAIGMLYDISLAAVVTFCVVSQLVAVPIFLFVGSRTFLQQPTGHDSRVK
jgi:hypothetical protein